MDRYNRETEEAIKLAENDKDVTGERRKALNLLIQRYPSIIKKYIDEKGHLKDILNLKREISEIEGQKKLKTIKISPRNMPIGLTLPRMALIYRKNRHVLNIFV